MSGKQDETPGAPEFSRLLAVVRELREKCAWDREQTLADTSRHLIEEAYEAADAIASENRADIAEELGDLIVQALFAAVIAAESDAQHAPGLLRNAADKLIRRHPHVYAGADASTVEQVLDQWESIKEGEAKKKRQGSSIAKTGRALPSLMRAEKLGEKARRRGMDWKDARDVLAKVREELEEVERALDAGNDAEAAEEVGDMMLALANVPRFLGRDAEQTLRRGCDKFVARFGEVERLATSRGLKLKTLSVSELEALWQEAKRSLRAGDTRS
ncbi:MAG: nucleoside triphosphate pyrophosphohydrolase [Candidatus Binataceae bacterium]